jgi:actin-related protein
MEVTPSEHAVVLSETPGTSAAAREAMAAAVLTDHGAGALWIVASPLLALFNSGRDTGVIVDVGESATYILMVYDGRPLAHAAVHPLAGGHAPNSGPDAACDVLFEPTLLAGIADGGEDGGGGNGEGGRGAGGATHGGSVSSGAPLRTAATIGVHEAVLRTIAVADSAAKPELLSNIVLIGGGSRLSGFAERLERELRLGLNASDSRMSLRVIANADRRLACWMGAAGACGLPSSRERFLLRSQWEAAEGRLKIHALAASLPCSIHGRESNPRAVPCPVSRSVL